MAEMIGPRQGVQPKAKAKPTKTPQRRLAAFDRMQPLIGIQGLDLNDARQMQAENDDHTPGHPLRYFLYSMDQLANAGGRRAQHHKHQGKAQDKHQRVQQHCIQ